MKADAILSLAKKHSICRELAAPDFFEGALLGNGNLGAVVCTRPDGIVAYIRVQSERGGIWQMVNPWEKCVDDAGNVYSDGVITIPMEPGAAVRLKEYI